MKSLLKFLKLVPLLATLSIAKPSIADVTLETEVKITDRAMFFDGQKVGRDAPDSSSGYDYFFGSALTPHGDCIKTYNEFVFMTWYRGGKEDRHVMLTRYNTETGSMATIEFPHRHTGYRGKWWIGETHNTIAIAVSPKNGTIHLLYDMHAYSQSTGPAFENDYFRYSYSMSGAASVPDEEFTLDQFVKSPDGDYKHLTMSGVENHSIWSGLTYPKFFQNDEGDLFMYMRKGSAKNGKYVFCRYDGVSKWSDLIEFNVTNAGSRGYVHNYGIYGEMKYADGKIRVGFQLRAAPSDDKYIYQNGIYYAYSDDQEGMTGWKNHKVESFSLPLVNPDHIKVYEPGDLVETTARDQVHMVGWFDFNVTARGDEHIIARVNDRENNVTKYVHAYRKSGDPEFTVTTEFGGGEELYAAGNNVYLIRLENGKPKIEKAEGGTNDWTTIYEPRGGKYFDKGVAYINNGKLYYYLKVPGTGDERTTYLQIIDLDLEETEETASNYVDTGDFLGWVETTYYPLIYSYALTAWMYIDAPSLNVETGSWLYLFR